MTEPTREHVERYVSDARVGCAKNELSDMDIAESWLRLHDEVERLQREARRLRYIIETVAEEGGVSGPMAKTMRRLLTATHPAPESEGA